MWICYHAAAAAEKLLKFQEEVFSEHVTVDKEWNELAVGFGSLGFWQGCVLGPPIFFVNEIYINCLEGVVPMFTTGVYHF